MFRRKKDNEIDISSLNVILATGRKLVNIGYFMAIIALVLLGTYLLKEWKILVVVKELLIVISPIFIGFFIAWLLEPAVNFLEDKKMPRVAACIFVYLILLGVLFLFFYLLIPTFAGQVKDFVGAIPGVFKDLTEFTNGIFSSLQHNMDVNIDTVKTQIYDAITSFSVELTTNLPDMLINFGKTLISGGMSLVLGLMIGFYMLFDFDKLNIYFLNSMPKRWRKNYNELVERLNKSLRNYIQGVLIIMLLVFVTQSIGLTLAGLEAPLVFALFCALTDIIPYFGPYIGAIPAIIVGFTISPITGICCVISIIVVQLLENNFYQPLIMGHTMKLHPVTIMIGLLIFQHFFGIIGMVVATPVIACLKVICMFINEKLNLMEKITGNENIIVDKEIVGVED